MPINSPLSPLHSSPSLSSDCAPRLPELLAGVLGFCHRNLWIPATPGDPAAPFQSLFTPLVLAHHLKRLICPKSQGNRTPHCHPTRSTPEASPAGALLLFRKQSTTPTKFSSSPCLPDHRRGIAAVHNSPEARQSSTSGRISGDLAGILVGTLAR
jgi:hypothetical protein